MRFPTLAMLILAASGTFACSTPLTSTEETSMQEDMAIGGTKDERGCLPSAGQSWSELRQACVQPFDVADIRMDDPANDTLAIYLLLSEDRQKAEVFGADIPPGTILTAVKGGYISADGRLHVQQDAQGQWQLRQR